MNRDPTQPRRIYEKLAALVPHLPNMVEGECWRVPGLIGMNFEATRRNGDRLWVRLFDTFESQSGVLVTEPDIEIAVFLRARTAHAVSYRDSNTARRLPRPPFGSYWELRRWLDDMLESWLDLVELQRAPWAEGPEFTRRE